MSDSISELKELNRQLTVLLDDPQPGLFMWNDAMFKTLAKIAGFVKDAPLPEDVRHFILRITLHLQKSRSMTPEQNDYMFQQAYRLYVKYEVEKE